ncbi:hypothetical protein CA13_31460 [Planctomycetes bacterium CA13]|uniref:Uncharacterized protein n=1 Tax=Novipirellula herctigrandis TaxID=2527986 RepID=A0A5C5Z554_9BACT|nr:hypothetical protein CA13_31460 [Planctomycetes bacterium CA13]
MSQHKSVYQKEHALPKRRCPRRGKPLNVTKANSVANEKMFQLLSRGLAKKPCYVPLALEEMFNLCAVASVRASRVTSQCHDAKANEKPV